MGGWKLRKDKLKVDKPEETAAPEAPEEQTEEHPRATGGAHVFDLSGDAFRTEDAVTGVSAGDEPSFEEGTELRFLDDTPVAMPGPTDEPVAMPGPAEAMAMPGPAATQSEEDSGALSAFTPYRSEGAMVVTPPDEPVAPPPVEEAVAPPPAAREAAVPTTAGIPLVMDADAETGLPRVAPYVVEVPPTQEPSEAEAAHHLVLHLGNLSATLPLTKDVTTIGRPDSAIALYPDVEIELDDAVSRRHAEVRRRQVQYYLVDVGSTNGTLLNGEALTPEREYPLQHGDRIRVGERTEIVFE